MKRAGAVLLVLAFAACSSSDPEASDRPRSTTTVRTGAPSTVAAAPLETPVTTATTSLPAAATPPEPAHLPEPLLAVVDAREDVFAFGSAGFHGSTGALVLAAPLVGMAATPSGNGYWLVASDGGVFTFGDALYLGGATDIPNRGRVVGIAATPTGRGYWLVSEAGGVYAFGDARFFGSAAGLALVPVVAIAATPSGDGYWVVARDGAVFGFGRAADVATTPISNVGIVGAASTPTGRGVWLAGRDGGVFAFGDAAFAGSVASLGLREPVVAIAGTPTGRGYWLAARDGGVFALGDAPFFGAAAGSDLGSKRAVAFAAHPGGRGYWMAAGIAHAPIYGPDVLAIGDSVMLGARPALQQRLPGISVDAVVSRQFGSVPGILASYRDRGLLRPVIVIHLGTNGTVAGSDLDRVMQIADGRRVVFVNVRVPRSWEGQSNAALADGVARWPNASIVDWRSVAANPANLAGDGFHMSGAGASAYAELIAAS